MGIDYNTSVYLGFRVEESDIFDMSERQTYSCKHVEDDPMLMDDGKFCSLCGRAFKIYTYKTRVFKSHLKEIFDREEYEPTFWTGDFGGYKVELTEMMGDCGGSRPIIAGIRLKSIDPKYESDMIFSCGSPNELPSESTLEDFLRSNQIPFSKDSFSIYMTHEVY